MRYYEVKFPGENEPYIATRIKGLKDLPDGTIITAIITERDGSLADSWDIPVIDGKPEVKRKGKNAPKYYGLR